MPVLFGLYFPTHSGATATWEPWKGPLASGPSGNTKITEHSGVVTNLLADRHNYNKAVEFDPFETWVLAFDELLDADRASFKTFQRTVLGAQFEMLEPLTATYKTCLFAPDQLDVDWQLDHEAMGNRWSLALTLFVQD